MESEFQKLEAKIDAQQAKMELMYQSVEKLRQYFKWTLIITIIVVVLPMIGLALALPTFMHNYVDQLDSLNSLNF